MSNIDILLPQKPPSPVLFGTHRVEQALLHNGFSAKRIGRMADSDSEFLLVAALLNEPGEALDLAGKAGPIAPDTAESISISRSDQGTRVIVAVSSADETGLMYALLEIAECVTRATPAQSPFTTVQETVESPFAAERSMSIYTMHQATWEERLHDRGRWVRTFETMAESRIDSFTIIFGYENGGYMAPAHPYFFDVPSFPDVYVAELSKKKQKHNADSFRYLIDMAHAHGVRVVAGLWDHIYRAGVQDGGIPNAPGTGEKRAGIVAGVNGDNVGAYNTAAIAQFLEEFPAIDGLQFRMHGESGLTRDEMGGFWHEVFSIIYDVRPDLRVDLRVKELPDEIIEDALEIGLSIRLTTKYWMEQMGLPFHPTHVNLQDQYGRRHGLADLLSHPRRAPVHWRLWNAVTHGGLVWADPEWVRRFVKSTAIGGRSFEFNEPNATWMLGQPSDQVKLDVLSKGHQWYRDELDRHKYTLRLFGRIGYDPGIPEYDLQQDFAAKFGAAGPIVMRALHAASKIVPRIVGSVYCYSLFPTTVGSAARDSQGPLWEFALAEGSDVQQFVSLREEADLILHGGRTARRRAGVTSEWFLRCAEYIEAEIDAAEAIGTPEGELFTLLCDARMAAHLARFYGHRIPAAVAYNLYISTGDLFALADAVDGERSAVAAWGLLSLVAEEIYGHNLPIGARRPSLYGNWRDEHRRLEGWLVELEEIYRQGVSAGGGSAARLCHVPVRSLSAGCDLAVQATVEWPYSTTKVNLRLIESGKPVRIIPLDKIRSRMYSTAIPAADLPNSFAYVIEALAPGGRRIATPGGIEEPIRVRAVGEMQRPQIEQEAVTTAIAGNPMAVTAMVTHQLGVESVRLRYRHLTQFEEYETVEMSGAGATYSAAIPAEFVVPEWDLVYFIEVFDTLGNGWIHPDLEIETPYIVVEVAQ